MSRFPGFITRNFRLKLGCAVLAVITWTGVVYAGNPPQTRPVHVPVPQAQSSIPQGFKLIRTIPDVLVRLGGTRDSLDTFDTSNIDIAVNWKAVKKAGVQSIPIQVTNNDPKVELLDAPSTVQADVDRTTSIFVPVKVVITANPPPGIVMGPQIAQPSSVAVSGPEQELKGVLVRAEVDLSAERANFQAQVDVHAYSANGSKLGDLEINPQQVTVSISLSSSITSRVVGVLPHIVGAVAQGYAVSRVSYAPLTVTLSGPQDLLNIIDSVSTVNISLNGLTGNVSVSVPLLGLPAGVTASSGLINVTIFVTQLTPPSPTPTPAPTP